MQIECAEARDREHGAGEDAKRHDHSDIRCKRPHCFCERRIFHGFRLEQRKMMLESEFLDGGRREFLSAAAGFVRSGHDTDDLVSGFDEPGQTGDRELRGPHEEDARGRHCMSVLCS